RLPDQGSLRSAVGISSAIEGCTLVFRAREGVASPVVYEAPSAVDRPAVREAQPRASRARRRDQVMDAQPEIRCPSCGHRNRSDRRYCAACGGHLGQACSSCGTRYNPEEKFCGACGAALSGAAAEGERRQLTVLFCDLVGSTALAGQLDPEDWREVMTRYQHAAAETITRFGGHVAKYLGDGLLAYCSYPQAHEDDPERAVRAGLALLDTVAELNHRLEPIHGVQLAVRIGMHTGPVVIGEGA